jgi:hypothetical protein
MSEVKHQSDFRYFFYHRDGLLDIFIGLAILFSSQLIRTDLVWMIGVYFPIFLPSWNSARKRLLYGRVGALDFDPLLHSKRDKGKKQINFLLGGLLLAGLGLFIALTLLSGLTNEWLRSTIPLILGGVFACIWIFVSRVLRLPRFYLYAFFTFASFAACQAGIVPFWGALAIIGGSVTIGGLILLSRFLQIHPNKKGR